MPWHFLCQNVSNIQIAKKRAKIGLYVNKNE